MDCFRSSCTFDDVSTTIQTMRNSFSQLIVSSLVFECIEISPSPVISSVLPCLWLFHSLSLSKLHAMHLKPFSQPLAPTINEATSLLSFTLFQPSCGETLTSTRLDHLCSTLLVPTVAFTLFTETKALVPISASSYHWRKIVRQDSAREKKSALQRMRQITRKGSPTIEV